MSTDRSRDVRVERAAVVAVERSLLQVEGWVSALPVSDFGIDLLAFRPQPFTAAPVQIKGASAGMTVWNRYGDAPIIMAYVIDPLGDTPLVSIMTGEEAWRLPSDYIARGGKASDHRVTNASYRWKRVPALLRAMLEEHQATTERWEDLLRRTSCAGPASAHRRTR